MTLFVATEPAGSPGYLSWDTIRALRDDGVAIGLHSHAHPHLPHLSEDGQNADLETSLTLFEAEMGNLPTLFAYPYGEADAASFALVRSRGMTAFGQHSGVLARGEDPAWLPRFALNEQYGSRDRFLRVVSALPIAATVSAPADPTIGPGDANPPVFAFTITDPALDTGHLACFGPDGQPAPVQISNRTVTVHLSAPLAPGRSRVNCTLPGPRDADGTQRWHWRGTQFLVPARTAR